MKIKCIGYSLKPEAFPEISPETRSTLNHDIPVMCEENARLGYAQGVRNTLIGTAVCGAVATGLTLLHKKRQQKKLTKVEVID